MWSRLATLDRTPPYLSHVAGGMEHLWLVMGWNVPLPCGPPSKSGICTVIRLVGILDLFRDGDMDGKLVEAVVYMFRGWIVDCYPALQGIYLDTLDFQYPFLPPDNPAVRSADWFQFLSVNPGVLSHLRYPSDLITGGDITRLVAPLHTGNNNHWAAVEIDFTAEAVRFGDSLELPMAQRNKDGITNFLRALRFDDSLTIDTLGELMYPPQKDGFSCGVCAWSTIERTVWPDTAPWNACYKQLERVEYALLLATQNGSPYSLVSTATV
ncbi:hypothetical protein PENSPDRAFT_595727 [Peniophora sp. CONT]|nr:hypothetical protein PENSPDRAFT_595727 [Peniophora sp. CONT]